MIVLYAENLDPYLDESQCATIPLRNRAGCIVVPLGREVSPKARSQHLFIGVDDLSLAEREVRRDEISRAKNSKPIPTDRIEIRCFNCKDN